MTIFTGIRHVKYAIIIDISIILGIGSEILVREVKAGNRYWLVRTFGGRYYSHFVQNNYIAIGWNEISDLEQIKEASKNQDVKEELYALAKKHIIKKEMNNQGES